MLFIFAELQLDPCTVGVAVSMELDQEVSRFLLLAIDILPPWRFGHPEDEDDDERGEKKL